MHHNQNDINQNRPHAGFTLIEIAIVLMIFGIMSLTFIQLSKTYLAKLQHERAERTVANAEDALDRYFSLFDRYPCPADSGLNPGDVNYGRENCSLAVSSGVRTGMMPVYAREAGEDIYLAELISETEMIQTNLQDPWNRPLTYAVTSVLNIPDGDLTAGAVRILDEHGQPTAGTTNAIGAHYIVVSHGSNFCDVQVGQSERENCDGDKDFVISLKSSAFNTTEAYDDYVSVGLFLEDDEADEFWRQIPSGGALSSNVVNLNSGNVGINTEEPKEVLEINGDVLAEAHIWGARICEENGAVPGGLSCVKAESLFQGVQCRNPGEYIDEIKRDAASGEWSVSCTPLKFEALTQQDCPVGYTLRGLYTNGEIACDEMASAGSGNCPIQTVHPAPSCPPGKTATKCKTETVQASYNPVSGQCDNPVVTTVYGGECTDLPAYKRVFDQPSFGDSGPELWHTESGFSVAAMSALRSPGNNYIEFGLLPRIPTLSTQSQGNADLCYNAFSGSNFNYPYSRGGSPFYGGSPEVTDNFEYLLKPGNGHSKCSAAYSDCCIVGEEVQSFDWTIRTQSPRAYWTNISCNFGDLPVPCGYSIEVSGTPKTQYYIDAECACEPVSIPPVAAKCGPPAGSLGTGTLQGHGRPAIAAPI